MQIEVYSLPANVNGHGFISWTIPSFFFEVFHSAVRLSMTDCVPSSSIRALLLIENRLLREALVRLFRKRPDLVVVGQTSPAADMPLAVLQTPCNVLVGDAFLAGRLRAGVAAKCGMLPGRKIILVGM